MPHGLTRAEWNRLYDARMRERLGWTEAESEGLADADDTAFNDGDDPAEAADEELTNWND